MAERVAKKSKIVYKGNQLLVAKVELPPPNKNTVLITSTSNDEINTETLELIYESKKKSNGGPIASITLQAEGALVQFESEAGKSI